MEDFIQQGVDVLFVLVGMDVEVGVAREHRRQLRLALVVENVARNAMGLGIGQFVANAQRGACTFADEHIALAQPCRVLVVDARVALTPLFRQAQVALAHMLGQHNVGALDVSDDAVIQVRIHAPATYRSRKINLLRHINLYLFQLTKIIKTLQISNFYISFLYFPKIDF